jgi:ABC-type Fe3+ transport system substrate-binding protein
MMTGIDSSLIEYREANALAFLGDLPNRKNIPDGMSSERGTWISFRMRYYGMTYNPRLIRKEDLPQRWDDLPKAEKLYGGQLGLWRGVTSWLLPLWGIKGEQWTTELIHALFKEVKPQIRKEGARALVMLASAGEFRAVLPSAAYQTKLEADKGAPVAFHALNIIPVTFSTVGVLKNAPGLHSSKLFLNWLLSKEGQLSQFAADGNPPIHKGLSDRGFVAYPEEIKGKQIAARNPELLGKDMEDLYKVINPYLSGSSRAGSNSGARPNKDSRK